VDILWTYRSRIGEQLTPGEEHIAMVSNGRELLTEIQAELAPRDDDTR